MTPVSSLKLTGYDNIFILGERSLTYTMKRLGPTTKHWGTPGLTVLHSEKNF